MTNLSFGKHENSGSPNVVKRVMKSVYYRVFTFVFRPYFRFQNQVNEYLHQMIQAQKDETARQYVQINEEILEIKQHLQEIDEQIIVNREHLQKIDRQKSIVREQLHKIEKQIIVDKEHLRDDIGSVARQTMLAKWKIIDHLEEKNLHPEEILTCTICGYQAAEKDFKTKESECIFRGGHLKRYVCPKCGVIFGPAKFMRQTEKELEEDYRVHYLGFSEGDSTGKEQRAFFMLQPEKKKVYLNYGCGEWSKSLQNLREQGYQVYGYEPYAPDDNSYIITSKEKLMKMRFDGIFSNDLLEHLTDPVKDLSEMKNILLHPESKMAHSTICFDYRQEFTRFHTHFFTGNSVEVMSRKAGLRIVDSVKESDDVPENFFYCYVFEPEHATANILSQMHLMGEAERMESGILLGDGGVIYGPYIHLMPRKYQIRVKIEGEPAVEPFKVTAWCGKKVLVKNELKSGSNHIYFELTEQQEDVEFLLKNEGSDIIVREIILE